MSPENKRDPPPHKATEDKGGLRRMKLNIEDFAGVEDVVGVEGAFD